VDLGSQLDIVDFKRAAVSSGRSFYYLKGDGALLELALVQYALSKLGALGFTPVLAPDLVKEDVLERCGFQPRGAETQVYALDERHSDGDGGIKCLAGTSEITLAALNMESTLNAALLPIKYAGVSHCFRAEAGGAGKESRGLYRVHQFTKVEMFVVGSGDAVESDAMLESLVEVQKEMYTELGLHYRVLDMPTLELGAPAYRKYDIEAWMPGRGIFGEISSASNCTDYQSRRLNTRYTPGPAGGSAFVHTLNGTAIAVPRIIIALLETGQQADGSVILPDVLAPFFGGRTHILPRVSPEKYCQVEKNRC
jgi:seryl-tRNA synthetase